VSRAASKAKWRLLKAGGITGRRYIGVMVVVGLELRIDRREIWQAGKINQGWLD